MSELKGNLGEEPLERLESILELWSELDDDAVVQRHPEEKMSGLGMSWGDSSHDYFSMKDLRDLAYELRQHELDEMGRELEGKRVRMTGTDHEGRHGYVSEYDSDRKILFVRLDAVLRPYMESITVGCGPLEVEETR